jgi:hypothetical protein
LRKGRDRGSCAGSGSTEIRHGSSCNPIDSSVSAAAAACASAASQSLPRSAAQAARAPVPHLLPGLAWAVQAGVILHVHRGDAALPLLVLLQAATAAGG